MYYVHTQPIKTFRMSMLLCWSCDKKIKVRKTGLIKRLTGPRFPSSEFFGCRDAESTHISMPDLKKQVQSDKVACLDLMRRFEIGLFSWITAWLSMKCMVIVPFVILMNSTASHEPKKSASKAIRLKSSKFQAIFGNHRNHYMDFSDQLK